MAGGALNDAIISKNQSNLLTNKKFTSVESPVNIMQTPKVICYIDEKRRINMENSVYFHHYFILVKSSVCSENFYLY